MKKILYIDMDGVLVDFDSKSKEISADILEKHRGDICNIRGVFLEMVPMPGAIDAFKKLSEKFDTYILTTAPWDNHFAWSEKLEWVKKYIGNVAEKRLIITCHKNLNKGDYLIDDMRRNGSERFEGELILFGSDEFLNWKNILDYLLKKE